MFFSEYSVFFDSHYIILYVWLYLHIVVENVIENLSLDGLR